MATTLSTSHEYMLSCVRKTSNSIDSKGRENAEGTERRPFRRSGTAESNFCYKRPKSFYAILLNNSTNEVLGIEPPGEDDRLSQWRKTDEEYTRVYPLGDQGIERIWRRSYEPCTSLVQNNKLQCSNEDGNLSDSLNLMNVDRSTLQQLGRLAIQCWYFWCEYC